MNAAVSVWPVEAGERIKALREALDLSQEDVARASNGYLDRQRVLRIESGVLKLNSDKQRKGLATAFGISRDALDALIDGSISVERAINLARRRTVEIASPDPSADGGDGLGSEIDMGVMIIERHRAAQAHLPNLMRCIDAHAHYEPPQSWSPATIAAASLLFSSDFPVNRWPEVLNRIEQVHMGVTAQVLNPAKVDRRPGAKS